jgi:hypothetical protein
MTGGSVRKSSSLSQWLPKIPALGLNVNILDDMPSASHLNYDMIRISNETQKGLKDGSAVVSRLNKKNLNVLCLTL